MKQIVARNIWVLISHQQLVQSSCSNGVCVQNEIYSFLDIHQPRAYYRNFEKYIPMNVLRFKLGGNKVVKQVIRRAYSYDNNKGNTLYGFQMLDLQQYLSGVDGASSDIFLQDPIVRYSDFDKDLRTYFFQNDTSPAFGEKKLIVPDEVYGSTNLRFFVFHLQIYEAYLASIVDWRQIFKTSWLLPLS